MVNVFVYGTLLYDGVIKALLDKKLENRPAILKDYKRCKKEIPGGKSWGPAIIEEKGSIVKGRVVFDLNDRDLDIFDRFELSADNAYERITCQVEFEDGKDMSVFTYRATEKIRQYLTGPWSEEEFEEKGLDHYVDERIPDLHQKWGI
jgi:gamma-glutamylcyclotransferase (GGCT)/AIG2-like uncharacterized protein YtfP